MPKSSNWTKELATPTPKPRKMDADALTDTEQALLAEFAKELISHFESFDLEDIIRYGLMKSKTLTRFKLTKWALSELLPFLKGKGLVKETLGCMDEPIFEVLPKPIQPVSS